MTTLRRGPIIDTRYSPSESYYRHVVYILGPTSTPTFRDPLSRGLTSPLLDSLNLRTITLFPYFRFFISSVF